MGQAAFPEYMATYFVTSDTRHSNYIIAGLLGLEKRGFVDLRFRTEPFRVRNRILLKDGFPSLSRRPYPWAPEVVIEHLPSQSRKRISFDLQDWDYMFSRHALERCDVVFKRAYTAESIAILRRHYPAASIRPMGPNHNVSCKSPAYRKALVKKVWLENCMKAAMDPRKALAKVASVTMRGKSTSCTRRSNMRTTPPSAPYVFFQVECHDWGNNAHANELNERRAMLIRSLRESLGEQFVGGMFFRKHRNEAFPDCETDVDSERNNYLSFVKHAAIVISTNGFGDSIPWKLAEYLEKGCCIVSEKLRHRLPFLLDDRTVRSFTTDDEAVRLCLALLQDEERRSEMQRNSRDCYQQHVRPDASVLNMLKQVFEDTARE